MKKFHKVYVNEALGYYKDNNKPLELILPMVYYPNPDEPFYTDFWRKYLNLCAGQIKETERNINAKN